MNPEWVGYLAGVLTTSAYVPQTVKVARERHTKSLSLFMYMLITGGIASWTAYGCIIGSPSMIIANGIAFLMAAYILLMKVKHG